MERDWSANADPSPRMAQEYDDTLLRFANVAFYLAARVESRDPELAGEFRQRARFLYALMLDDTTSRSATGLESARHQLRLFSALLAGLSADPAHQDDCRLADEVLHHFSALVAARRQALFSFD